MVCSSLINKVFLVSLTNLHPFIIFWNKINLTDPKKPFLLLMCYCILTDRLIFIVAILHRSEFHVYKCSAAENELLAGT